MPFFRKKPVVVEAIQYTGENIKEIIIFTKGKSKIHNAQDELSQMLVITTLEGNMVISKGNWVIKGVKGEFYSCDPEIFNITYEKTHVG